MALVKSDISNLLLAGIRTEFFRAYDSTEGMSDFQNVCTIVDSGKDTETYAWLGSTPKMREWKDERLPQALLEHSYSIKNKTWEASIAVDRAAIEDEQYGQIRVRVQSLAEEVRRHADEVVFGLLKDGFTGLAYDGKAFFANDHSEGDSGTVDNLGSGAISASNLKASIIAMRKFKDDKGKPMGVVPNVVCVSPDQQWDALELTRSPIQVYAGIPSTASSSGSDYINVLQGSVTVIVSPYLTDSTDWFLLDTRGAVKPLIFQSRMPVEFASLENESETGFMRDQYIYGVRARYNVGYGLYQRAYGCT